jgi:hypothetical protein
MQRGHSVRGQRVTERRSDLIRQWADGIRERCHSAVRERIQVGVSRQWRIEHVSPGAFKRFEHAVTIDGRQVH